MRLRLFWKLALTYTLLLLAVLLAVDIYATGALRRDYLRLTYDQLESLARIAESRLPRLDDPHALSLWAAWIGHSGARVTIVAADGRVLADSAEDPNKMENHASRPEIQEAMASGQGRAVRHSHTLNRDLVYLAIRHPRAEGPPIVVRLSLPREQVDQALGDIRRRLVGASLVILLLAVGVSFLFTQVFSSRVEQLKQFSRRVARGDFRLFPIERAGDELTDLARALNDTAAQLDRTIRTLTDERNQSAAILSSMAEGVVVVGADERIVFCNETFCRAMAVEGFSPEGRPLVEVVRQSELLAVVQEVLKRGEGLSRELELGTVRPQSFAVTAAPIRTDRTAAVVLVLHDISELRRLERVRRDFVANVSHELKTPLTAIQGFAETLLGGALDDAKNSQRFLEIIRDHALRMGRLADDLLKLSLMEAGKLELEIRPLSISEIVEPCVELTRLKASPKQLILVAEYSPELPPLLGDAARLREALQNLLDNAVQYTPPGGEITIRVAAQGHEVAIAVADTGVGIPQVEQERIFERFYRVDAARSREVGGTGLGLSITKHLVEVQGGSIRVESEVGRGSTFTVILPAAEVEPVIRNS